MDSSVEFENGNIKETIESIATAIDDKCIEVVGFYNNSKSSEKNVVVIYKFEEEQKEVVIPYVYRRTGMFVDKKEELVKLICESKDCFSSMSINQFKETIKKDLSRVFGERSDVTKPIFLKLLKNCGEWVSNKKFKNTNAQRRIQDLKEKGFTISTKYDKRTTYHMLLPFPQKQSVVYETISKEMRRKIFETLGGVNAYNGKNISISCLPDHKFPEIRWDSQTPKKNYNLGEKEIKDKFQLVPEDINQMKREICRECFQNGVRGKLNGINFFYEGTERWDNSIPKIGENAEKGCVGCFWYDMVKWRMCLNKIIEELK